ncbi:hypothetical protein V4F39_19525 [Aquincola sp. MAHUQ-54]|uniref:Uncharacterized protein n=1 Tax=Aquincola agrisoli TaxID=3119538 RepID=A0AAW9QL31_9BURK
MPAAHRVLAVGADAALLAGAHGARWPGARWWATDLPGEAAGGPMPEAVQWLSDVDAADAPQAVDLLVLGSAFAGLSGALPWLRQVSQRCTRRARLVLMLNNASSATHIEHLLQADATPEGVGADPAVPRQTPPTLYKLLMDAGWMPRLLHHTDCEPASAASGDALRMAAQALGVGAGQVDLLHRMQRLVIAAERDMEHAPIEPGAARFSVVVPTTDARQLRANVECSPGLHEVGARIVSVRNVASPADAIEQARPHCEADWVLMCHQDVYFPAGFGEQLNAVLASIPAEERSATLIGFVGMGVDRAKRQPVNAGHVIDRLSRADFEASDTALSIDELAIVMARDSVHRIDPGIGWHLWATELCLTSIKTHGRFPRIVRLPLFHNSRTGWTLPGAFYDAAEYLMARHADFVPIHTLCGVLDAAFLQRRPREN